jgi:hypothetical protein
LFFYYLLPSPMFTRGIFAQDYLVVRHGFLELVMSGRNRGIGFPGAERERGKRGDAGSATPQRDAAFRISHTANQIMDQNRPSNIRAVPSLQPCALPLAFQPCVLSRVSAFCSPPDSEC